MAAASSADTARSSSALSADRRFASALPGGSVFLTAWAFCKRACGDGSSGAGARRFFGAVRTVRTGARAVEPPVPGTDLPHVVRAWDVLSGKAWDIGRNVVVVGGSATGCETALFISSMGVPDAEAFTFLMYHSAEDPSFAMDLLHRSGRRITVIDMVPRLAENVGRTARWSLLKGLRLMGVVLRPGTRLLEITEDSVVVETSGGEEIIPADTVVTASGAASVNELADEVRTLGIEVITVGDAVEPRRITEAVREGFEEALKI